MILIDAVIPTVFCPIFLITILDGAGRPSDRANILRDAATEQSCLEAGTSVEANTARRQRIESAFIAFLNYNL